MTITDDQNRIVSYYLDMMGQPHEVRSDQSFDGGKRKIRRRISALAAGATGGMEERGAVDRRAETRRSTAAHYTGLPLCSGTRTMSPACRRSGAVAASSTASPRKKKTSESAK